MVHVLAETVELGSPLELTSLPDFLLVQALLELLQLSLHSIPKILEVLRGLYLENVLEGTLQPAFNLPELLLVSQTRNTELILLFLFPSHLLRGEDTLPAKFGLVVLGHFGFPSEGLRLVLLQIGEHISCWFDFKIEIFEGIGFNILLRKQVVYLVVLSGIPDFSSHLFSKAAGTIPINMFSLFLLENQMIEFTGLLQMKQIFQPQIPYYPLPYLTIVKHVLQFEIIYIHQFFINLVHWLRHRPRFYIDQAQAFFEFFIFFSQHLHLLLHGPTPLLAFLYSIPSGTQFQLQPFLCLPQTSNFSIQLFLTFPLFLIDLCHLITMALLNR